MNARGTDTNADGYNQSLAATIRAKYISTVDADKKEKEIACKFVFVFFCICLIQTLHTDTVFIFNPD